MSRVVLLIIANAPVRARTAEERERSYLYGLHLNSGHGGDLVGVEIDATWRPHLKTAIYFNVESKNGRGAKC